MGRKKKDQTIKDLKADWLSDQRTLELIRFRDLEASMAVEILKEVIKEWRKSE